MLWRFCMAEVLCGFCLAEVRSRSGASAWPRSGRPLWLLHGRGQIVLWRFCVAEVRSRSVASAWPRSGRALWLLHGRGQVFVRGFSSFSCAVHGVFGEPWSYRFEAGCFARLRSEWGLFFFCSPVQFSFSVVHCGSGILVGWALGSSHCCSREYCHRLNRYVSWRWRLFIVSGHAVSRTTAVFRFWLPLPRLYCASTVHCSVSIGVTSGVSVDLTSTESMFEVLVSARVLLARFTLVICVF